MTGWDELKLNVIEKGNCCLCGTCIGVCPMHVPVFIGGSIVSSSNCCISCSKCTDACPGLSFDFRKMNLSLFKAEYETINHDFGYYRKILKAYACDSAIREKASSGGVVTALACYMLEKGVVDYVTGIISNSTDIHSSVLNTPQEVIRAAQSKYIFVPMNETLQYIQTHEGRYLYIGLPCQVQGLRKACEKNPLLKNRIILIAGLFCGFNLTEDATNFLIRKSGIEKDEIKTIEYRGKQRGETGFKITSEDKSFFISKHGYTILNAIYSQERCWKCYDLTAEFADLSFGDVWEDGDGKTRIIIRSRYAEDLIREMIEAKYISSFPSSEEEMYSSQKKIISYKKHDIHTRHEIMKDFPRYNVPMPGLNFIQKIKALLFFCMLKFGQTDFCRRMLRLLPINLLENISRSLRDGRFTELISYGFWGIATTLVNLLSYWLLVTGGLNYRTANLLTIFITKAAAYIFNKYFVFKSDTKGYKTFRELLRFLLSRGISAVIDYYGLILLVDTFGLGKYSGKIIMLITVTIINYFSGKYFVYKK